MALRCQIQLEVTRRQYSGEDQTRMRDLFGEPERWGQTLKNMLWTPDRQRGRTRVSGQHPG